MASQRRAVGRVTRGTTNANRLRRFDRWSVFALGGVLRGADDPLVVDLGYGARPVTTVEWFERLRSVRADVEMVGVEIDPERVAAARPHAGAGLSFRHGGFELALDGRSPVIVRAFNVLRQYDETEVAGAWAQVVGRLASGGVFVDGTSDELGRLCTWATIYADDMPDASHAVTGRRRVDGATAVMPRSLTFAAAVAQLEQPSQLAERLPKALIHHNMPGERVHALLSAWDEAWQASAPYRVFGARQQWVASIVRLRVQHPEFGIAPAASRWRLGELTVPWRTVAPD